MHSDSPLHAPQRVHTISQTVWDTTNQCSTKHITVNTEREKKRRKRDLGRGRRRRGGVWGDKMKLVVNGDILTAVAGETGYDGRDPEGAKIPAFGR